MCLEVRTVPSNLDTDIFQVSSDSSDSSGFLGSYFNRICPRLPEARVDQ